MDIKERRRQRAIARSRSAAPKKKQPRDDDSLARLERYRQHQILFRKYTM